MAIVLLDSFDLYNGVGANTGLQAKWNVTASGSLSMQTGRIGGQCLRMTGGSAVSFERGLGVASASLSFGFAARVNTLPTLNTIFGHWLVKSGATWQCGFRVNTSGGIDAYRLSSDTAGTLLGSTANALINTGVWNYIEAEIVISTTVGRITLWLNGTQILNLTGQNTANAGVGTTADTFRSNIINGSTGIGNIEFDDLYITDAATKLGECRLEPLYPTSDVAQGFARSSGSVNYSLVDEAQVNGDTDYVQGSTVGDVDTYGFGDLSSTPAAILAVQLTTFAQKTDATSRSIALQAKSGATTSDGSNFALATSYSKFERILETDPDTAAAWTASGVNALQGGPKVTV